jgi:hypothetical protein
MVERDSRRDGRERQMAEGQKQQDSEKGHIGEDS